MIPDNLSYQELGNLEEAQQNDTHNSNDNPVTQEELEAPDQQQPNQPLNKQPEIDAVSSGANESEDPEDSNTGGSSAGGTKNPSKI